MTQPPSEPPPLPSENSDPQDARSPSEPPPLPSDVDVSSKQESIPEKCRRLAKQFAATAKSAAALTAKQTERAKIQNVSLPQAFAALGKHVYSANSHREDFDDLFGELDDLHAKVEELATRANSRPTGDNITDKAKAVAASAKDKAEAQTQRLKISRLAAKLGKAVYGSYGRGSAPEELLRPIEQLMARTEVLTGDITRLGSGGKNQLVTRRRITLFGILAIGVIGVSALFRNGVPPHGESNTSEDTFIVDPENQPIYVESPLTVVSKDQFSLGSDVFSFSPNGEYLLVRSLLFDMRDGQKVEGLGNRAPAAFSPDGNRIACVRQERGTETSLELFDLDTRTFTHAVPIGLGGVPWAPQYEVYWPTDSVVVISRPRSCHVVKVKGRDTETIQVQDGVVSNFSVPPVARISPDGTLIATGLGGDTTVHSVATGERLHSASEHLEGFTPDGAVLVTQTMAKRTLTGEYTAWRVGDWTVEKRDSFLWQRTENAHFRTTFFREGADIVAAAAGGNSPDDNSSPLPFQRVYDYSESVNQGFAMSQNERFGVQMLEDSTLEVWDLPASRLKAVLGRPDGNQRKALAVSDDGRAVVAAAAGGREFEVWKTDDGRSIQQASYMRHRRSAFDPTRTPAFYTRKAPPIRKQDFDNIRTGMMAPEVWELLGGRPLKDDSDMRMEDSISDGKVFEGINWKHSRVELYAGDGGEGSVVVLEYEGESIPPPLIRKRQVGLK